MWYKRHHSQWLELRDGMVKEDIGKMLNLCRGYRNWDRRHSHKLTVKGPHRPCYLFTSLAFTTTHRLMAPIFMSSAQVVLEPQMIPTIADWISPAKYYADIANSIFKTNIYFLILQKTQFPRLKYTIILTSPSFLDIVGCNKSFFFNKEGMN